MRFRNASFVLLCGAFICMASTTSFASCEAPPTPVVDFYSVSPYADEHHSVIDPALAAQREEITKPVEDFEKGIARSASEYSAKSKPR